MPAYTDDLHKLRKYRNKVHIQSDVDIERVSRDEEVAFSDALSNWALGLNVKVLKHLNGQLGRPKDLDAYVAPLIVPEFQEAKPVMNILLKK